MPELSTTFRLVRSRFFPDHTAGRLYVDEHFLVWILEDADRGLTDSMDLDEIERLKVYGKTAIPYGKYELGWHQSPRFKKKLPQLLGVKGFNHILLHSGNYPSDTEGCLLPGLVYRDGMVTNSRVAYSNLEKLIIEAQKRGKVYLHIIKE